MLYTRLQILVNAMYYCKMSYYIVQRRRINAHITINYHQVYIYIFP